MHGLRFTRHALLGGLVGLALLLTGGKLEVATAPLGTPSGGSSVLRTGVDIGDLPSCTAALKGQTRTVKDAATLTGCGPATGTTVNVCMCDGTNWIDDGDGTGAGGGDAVSVNGVAVIDVDLDNALPAAPANALNVIWQTVGSAPADISAHVTRAALEALVRHNNLVGYVAGEHVLHSGVVITAGAGLAGGGNIATSFSLGLLTSEAGSIATSTVGPAADGALMIDTNADGTNVLTDTLNYQSGSEDFYIPAAREYPTVDGQVLTFVAANNDYAWLVPAAGSHAGTITWTGTSILESGVAFQFGDGTDATLTHTYATSGTDPTIAYSTTGISITNAALFAVDGVGDFNSITLSGDSTNPELSVLTSTFRVDSDTDGTYELSLDAAGNLTLLGGLTLGPTGTPGWDFKDDDNADDEVNVAIDVNCTTIATTAEDCDFLLQAYYNGAMVTVMEFDADPGDLDLGSGVTGPITIGSASATVVTISTDGTGDGEIVLPNDSIGDAEVLNTITVSNYLLLAGGTLTGELVLDELGIEGQPTDAITDCTSFAATGGGMFYDDSEGKWKKCEDNVLTLLDTTGGTPAFSGISSGTNITAAMLVGTGASLGATGTGTITATALIQDGDAAEGGIIRLQNDAEVCWESAPADANEACFKVDSSEQFHFAHNLDGGVARINIENSFPNTAGSTDETAGFAFVFGGVNAALIRAMKEADFTPGADQDAQLVFHTILDGVMSKRMTLDSAGELWIDNTDDSPHVSLHLQSGDTTSQQADIDIHDWDGSVVWSLGKTNTNTFRIQGVVNRIELDAGGANLYRTAGGADSHQFSDAAGTLRFQVLNSDKICIGTGSTTCIEDISAGIYGFNATAGIAPTVDGQLGYNPTSDTWVYGDSGSTRTVLHSASALAGDNIVDDSIDDTELADVLSVTTSLAIGLTNPAETGVLLLENNALIGWEDTEGTQEVGIRVDALEQFQIVASEGGIGLVTTTATECVVLNAGGATQKAAGTSVLTTYDGTNFSYPAWDLDSATDEQIDWNYGLPKNLAGTTATIEVRWSAAACTAATADDVCFVWNGGGLQDDDLLHTAAFSGTETFIQDKCTAANDEQWSAATSWTHGYDLTNDKGAIFQIIREQVADASCTGDNDAITGDVKLVAVRICHEVDNVFSGE